MVGRSASIIGRAEQLVEGEDVGLHVGVQGRGVLGVVGVVGDRELDRAVAHAALGVAGVPEQLASLGDALGRAGERAGLVGEHAERDGVVGDARAGLERAPVAGLGPRAGGGVVVLGRAGGGRRRSAVTVADVSNGAGRMIWTWFPSSGDRWMAMGLGVAGATSSAMSTAAGVDGRRGGMAVGGPAGGRGAAGRAGRGGEAARLDQQEHDDGGAVAERAAMPAVTPPPVGDSATNGSESL